jgi:hypothetical protein
LLLVVLALVMPVTALSGASAALEPYIEIEGRPLSEFLQWVSCVSGRKLVLTDDGARRQVESIRMHGSIRGLTLIEALSAVMASTSLRFGLSPDALRISSASAVSATGSRAH